MISWWSALMLGLLGATVADGSRIGGVMLTAKRWPWSRSGQRAPFVVGLLIRAGSAGILSAVIALQQIVGWSDQPLVLFVLGIATPTVVQNTTRLGRAVAKAIMTEYFGGGGGAGGV
jgi:hypothetical protein